VTTRSRAEAPPGRPAITSLGRRGRAARRTGDRCGRPEHVDEIAVRPGAHRRHRARRRAVNERSSSRHVDELVREQTVRRIGEARLRLDRAGLDVDLVVEGGEGAVVELSVRVRSQAATASGAPRPTLAWISGTRSCGTENSTSIGLSWVMTATPAASPAPM
jgi:hypothetical protein